MYATYFYSSRHKYKKKMTSASRIEDCSFWEGSVRCAKKSKARVAATHSIDAFQPLAKKVKGSGRNKKTAGDLPLAAVSSTTARRPSAPKAAKVDKQNKDHFSSVYMPLVAIMEQHASEHATPDATLRLEELPETITQHASERLLLRACGVKESTDKILTASAFLKANPTMALALEAGSRSLPLLSDAKPCGNLLAKLCEDGGVAASLFWSFMFGDAGRLYGGIKGCSSDKTLACMDTDRKAHDAASTGFNAVQEFLKRHFVFLSEEAACGTTFPLFSSVLAYTRSRVGLSCVYLELLVAIVVWSEHASAFEACLGGSLYSLRVAVAFVDHSNALGDAVLMLPNANVPEQWVKALCEAACTASAVKRRDGYCSTAWRCQFAGMGNVLEAAYGYFKALAAAQPDVQGITATARAHEVLELARPVGTLEAGSESCGIDITEASVNGARLPVSEYQNDFSWMFVAAAVLAGPALRFQGSVIDAIEALFLLNNDIVEACAWGSLCIPVTSAFLSSPLSKLPEETAGVAARESLCMPAPGKPLPVSMLPAEPVGGSGTVAEETPPWPLAALQLLIFKDASVRYHAVFKCRFGKKHDSFLFESSGFSPPDTPFGASTRQLSGVLPALNCLAASSGGLDVISATVTASILLHAEVNDMFTFADKALRNTLKDTLKAQLADFPGASCHYAFEGSFLTHASTALWAWMLDGYTRRQFETCDNTSLRMMALACQASVQHPDLEQLAAWTALVRLCSNPVTSVPVLLSRSSGGGATLPALGTPAGKLALADAETPLVALFTAFGNEEDMHLAKVRYAQTISFVKAAACLARRSVTLRQLENIGHAAFRRALVERVLLRGQWGPDEFAESERAIVCALFETNEALEAFLMARYGNQPARPIVTPYVEEADRLQLSSYLSLLVSAVDATNACTCREANATLYYLQPMKHLETLIERIAVSCVIWE